MGGSTERGRLGRIVGVAASLLLLAAACGGGEDQDGAAATITAPPTVVGSDARSTPSSGPATTPIDEDVETMDDLEARWAERRAAVVASLSADSYGIDEKSVLVGPSQFSVDLGKCPAGWSDVTGLTDTTITIGLILPQSGDQAAYNDLWLGMKVYFDWVNAHGGIGGRTLRLVTRDDGYDPATTPAALADLLAADNPFYVTTVGTPGSLAVYDQLNKGCIPQPFAATSHPALADPVAHPWSTGLQMSYPTEAVLWGNWLKQNLGGKGPVSVGALVIDNDFGQIYANAFQQWADANPDVVSGVTVVKHAPAVTSVSKEMAKLAEGQPQVLLAMTNGPACTSAMQEAATTGLDATALVRFLPSVCTGADAYMNPAGPAADGVYAVGPGVVSLNDPAHAEDTFVRFAVEELDAADLDPTRELLGVGFGQYGWAHVEILRIAAALPGGLTRSNVLLALRGADLVHPLVDEGVRFTTSGAADAYFVEGAAYNRYDAKVKGWYPQGTAIDLNGSSPACEWVRGVCQR